MRKIIPWLVALGVMFGLPLLISEQMSSRQFREYGDITIYICLFGGVALGVVANHLLAIPKDEEDMRRREKNTTEGVLLMISIIFCMGVGFGLGKLLEVLLELRKVALGEILAGVGLFCGFGLYLWLQDHLRR
ncbi:MAG: hypothetical protein PWQ57_3413 [Desulfovibrionales bacterium]|nr:hypothetical protein [Desulfovibrionales bacterium]